MTKVTLFRSEGRAVGFEAVGHAGDAPEGENIVCAAVSAITQTAIEGLSGYLGIKGAMSIAEAQLYYMLPDDISNEAWHDAETILETMAWGLRSIAETNGDYIRIFEREV